MTITDPRDEEARPAEANRNETPHERLDRNLTELVGELRVALPGVQVLFAFLLTVPFNQRFGQVSSFEETIYLITLLSTAAATGLLLAPSALHRIQFRQDDKKHIVSAANRYAIAGFAALLVAVTGAVLLVTDVLFEASTVTVTLVVLASLYLTLWFGFPLVRRMQK